MTNYIPRALEPVVRKHSNHFKAVLVTGPRQVGKTTMLKHLMEQEEAEGIHRVYVSMDDTALRQAAVSDPALFLQRYDLPILIDEVQKAPELLPYIKIILDETDKMGTVWLTGSQPLHLMKHVSESLAGRISIIEMLGLSHAEISGIPSEPFIPGQDYFHSRMAMASPVSVKEMFGNIFAGSLPAIRALPDDLRAAAYEAYLDTYVMRDIRDLSQVGDELKFRRFVTAAAALTSRPVVYSELARIADINEKTAKSWLALLEASYLVKLVPAYSNNILKRLNKQPIMHFTDTGLAAYLTGWANPQTLESGAMNGQIFESYAYGEIVRSYLNAGVRPPLWFFRSNDKKEIDLLLERDSSLFPIEIKKSASPRLSDARNFRVLNPLESEDVPAELSVLKRDLGCGTIVCMSNDAYPLGEDIWAFPLWGI